MHTMKTRTEWLRATFPKVEGTVDREANVIRGYVLAQEGPFKTEGRGEFDLLGLKEIARQGNAKKGGLPVNFGHETLSADALGKHLGRARDLRLDTVTVERQGKMVKLHAVRGDLHFNKTALEPPPGEGGKPLGIYVMDLAESDPDAISSSLVIDPEELFRTDEKGRPLLDEEGRELPPLWIPKKVHGSDIVSRGDAVDGLLSADQLSLPDTAVRQGCQLLDKLFAGQVRAVVESRLQGWLHRYLERRFGEEEQPAEAPRLKARLLRLREQQLALDKLKGA